MSAAGGTEVGDGEPAASSTAVAGDRRVGSGAVAAGGDRHDNQFEKPEDLDDDQLVRTTSRSHQRPSRAVLLLGALLVTALANLVMVWLLLGTTTQVRDQYAVANGLQRCLIRAQLAENSSTDPSGAAYKTAVRACISK